MGIDKKVIFKGGPRDGEEIIWTQPCAPRDRMDYHQDTKAHIYKQAVRYSDDTRIVYYYIHTNTVSIKTVNNPYY